MLAWQYGWAKDDILYGIYPDEVPRLLKKINHRRGVEFEIQLAITQNHRTKDPKALISELRKMRQTPQKAPQLDTAAFELMKNTLSRTGKFNIK